MPPLPKRKTLDSLEVERNKPSKQPRLDAFFLPARAAGATAHTGQIPLSTTANKNIAASPSANVESGPKLSHEQEAVLSMVVDEGRSVFFTGSAGTGKSLLLRSIIEAIRKKYAKKPECLAVCASTGIAAQNIGGTTIHAWGAVTPGMHDIGKLISFIKTCRPAHRRWRAVKVLIIDEISMVDGKLFDTLAALATELRKKPDMPFGGIQLVMTGDFFQLPPVTPSGRDVCFAFQSSAWKSSIERTVTLTQVFRQKDSRFVALLNDMRKGVISPTAAKTLQALSRPLSQTDGDLLPTELFPLRAEVDRANASRMAALPGPAYVFESRDTGPAPPDKKRRLLDNMAVVKTLTLKHDAQVMLVKNVSETLVNGSVGRLVGFCEDTAASQQKKDETLKELFPIVEFATFKGKETKMVTSEEFRAEDGDGNLLARRVQIPLVLAWAMSIHKAQGQTIQRVKVDLNKAFERGQSYVALSRAATLEGLQVIGFDTKRVVAHPKVIEFSSLRPSLPDPQMPLPK